MEVGFHAARPVAAELPHSERPGDLPPREALRCPVGAVHGRGVARRLDGQRARSLTVVGRKRISAGVQQSVLATATSVPHEAHARFGPSRPSDPQHPLSGPTDRTRVSTGARTKAGAKPGAEGEHDQDSQDRGRASASASVGATTAVVGSSGQTSAVEAALKLESLLGQHSILASDRMRAHPRGRRSRRGGQLRRGQECRHDQPGAVAGHAGLGARSVRQGVGAARPGAVQLLAWPVHRGHRGAAERQGPAGHLRGPARRPLRHPEPGPAGPDGGAGRRPDAHRPPGAGRGRLRGAELHRVGHAVPAVLSAHLRPGCDAGTGPAAAGAGPAAGLLRGDAALLADQADGRARRARRRCYAVGRR